MSSTHPVYEKSYTSAPLDAPGGLVHNLYLGFFKQMGTRDGRAMTARPVGAWYDSRFKNLKQLEYQLPPGMKNFR
jgi:hypothetical protein